MTHSTVSVIHLHWLHGTV